MFISQNLAAVNAQRHLFNTNMALDRTMERLSSGLRINSAADDASGLAMAEKMAAQGAGLAVALQNAQDGQALYKVAEGALAQVNLMLTRMAEIAVRATNGTLTGSDRDAATAEIRELRDQIHKITSATEYNTLKLLNGGMSVAASLNITQGSSDVLRITGTSAYMKQGDSYAFALTSAATAAIISSTQASASATESGIISVNGIDISIASGDTAAAVAGKINAQNASHKVIAAVRSTGALVLVSGILDDDAKHVDNLSQNVLGFALLGSAYTVSLDGNGTLLTDFGLTGKVSGTNAAGTIDGVAMQAVGGVGGGTRLRDANMNSGTFGLEITTDLFKAAGATYVYDDQGDVAASVVYRGKDGDAATITIDTGRRLRLQIGANYDQSAYGSIGNLGLASLGAGGSVKFASLADIRVDSAENAAISLKVIQKSIEDVSSARSRIGASMNRLDYALRTLGIQRENLIAAQQRIQDADYSAEMVAYTRQAILMQTATAMLAQANARPQAVLQLLQ